MNADPEVFVALNCVLRPNIWDTLKQDSKKDKIIIFTNIMATKYFGYHLLQGSRIFLFKMIIFISLANSLSHQESVCVALPTTDAKTLWLLSALLLNFVLLIIG